MSRREVVKCLVEEYHIDTSQLNEVCVYLFSIDYILPIVTVSMMIFTSLHHNDVM